MPQYTSTQYIVVLLFTSIKLPFPLYGAWSYTFPNACSKSLIKSSAFSIPTLQVWNNHIQGVIYTQQSLQQGQNCNCHTTYIMRLTRQTILFPPGILVNRCSSCIVTPTKASVEHVASELILALHDCCQPHPLTFGNWVTTQLIKNFEKWWLCPITGNKVF